MIILFCLALAVAEPVYPERQAAEFHEIRVDLDWVWRELKRMREEWLDSEGGE